MEATTLKGALQLIQVILCIALVLVIILQAKGINLLGDSGMGITKTRRGLEKTFFQITIILAALFLINSIVQLMLARATTS
jgi:preprotein translocase subunit SecG